MNKYVKALIATIALAGICSSAFAMYQLKDFKAEPAQCEAGWCNVKQTVVLEDGSFEQTEVKVWVGK